MRVRTGWVVLALLLGIAAPAVAQDDESSEDQASESGDAAQDGSEGGGEGQAEPDQANAPDKANALRAWSFGPYFRFNVVPAFMLELMLDIAPTPTGPAFGGLASYRGNADGPTFDMGIGYASYSFTGPFRTKGGVANDTEYVQSSLGLVHLTGSILWEAKIAEPLTFLYGVGLDLGIVTGQLKRTEAYLDPASNSWKKCAGPAVGHLYCQYPSTIGRTTDPYDKKGEQYNVVDKGVPPVMGFPMLPHLALLYTPIDDLSLRVDAGYGIVQFWFGFVAAYAPKL
jgi:hypothetical protein